MVVTTWIELWAKHCATDDKGSGFGDSWNNASLQALTLKEGQQKKRIRKSRKAKQEEQNKKERKKAGEAGEEHWCLNNRAANW